MNVDPWQIVLILELILVLASTALTAGPMVQTMLAWKFLGGGLGWLRSASALQTVGLMIISMWSLLVNLDATFNESKAFGDMPQRAHMAVLFWMPLALGMPLLLFAYRETLKQFAHDHPDPKENKSGDTS